MNFSKLYFYHWDKCIVSGSQLKLELKCQHIWIQFSERKVNMSKDGEHFASQVNAGASDEALYKLAQCSGVQIYSRF